MKTAQHFLALDLFVAKEIAHFIMKSSNHRRLQARPDIVSPIQRPLACRRIQQAERSTHNLLAIARGEVFLNLAGTAEQRLSLDAGVELKPLRRPLEAADEVAVMNIPGSIQKIEVLCKGRHGYQQSNDQFHKLQFATPHGILKAPLSVRFQIPLSTGGGPLFRQVYLAFRRAIAVGDLCPGERLPATRDLAEQLGVSRTVALAAFDQLMAEGWIEGRAGSGTFVAAGVATTTRPVSSKQVSTIRVSRYGEAAAAAAPAAQVPARRVKPLRYDFTYGRSAVGEFPFEQWRRILTRLARMAPARAFDYGPSEGSAALREAIAQHLRRSRAVVCDASRVIIVNGSQQALDLTTRVLAEPGDVVAIENPHYQGAREIFRAAQMKLYPVPVDSSGLIPARLPARARLAFITPSHQFPTGTILPLSRRLELLEWANKVDAVIIEDDYDGEFRYGGNAVESMQGLDTSGRVVYIGTFSRTIFPALRIGYVVVPSPLVKPLAAAKWLCDRHTATLEQETLAEFITSGAYERHLRRARRANASRLRVLLEAVATHIGDRVTITGAGSGTHLVLWPKGSTSEGALVEAAAALGVGVYGISSYFLEGHSQRSGLLVGFARLHEREIREGIKRLATLLK